MLEIIWCVLCILIWGLSSLLLWPVKLVIGCHVNLHTWDLESERDRDGIKDLHYKCVRCGKYKHESRY